MYQDLKKTNSYLSIYSQNSIIDDRKKKNIIQKKYQQVFGEDFIKNLSVLDLIFNVGPNASEYICIS